MEAKEIMADGRNDERQGMLLGLQVVELIDEALKLGHGVAALVGGKTIPIAPEAAAPCSR